MKSTNLQKKDTPILGLQGLWSLEPFLVGIEQKYFCQNVFYNHQVGNPEISIEIPQFWSKWEAKSQNFPRNFIIQKGSDLAL